MCINLIAKEGKRFGIVAGIDHRNLQLRLQRDIHDFKGSSRYECLSACSTASKHRTSASARNNRCETQASSFTAEVRAAHKPFENLHDINSGSGIQTRRKNPSATISRFNRLFLRPTFVYGSRMQGAHGLEAHPTTCHIIKYTATVGNNRHNHNS